MKCRCKMFDTNSPAADGSIIPKEVLLRYLSSEEYKRSIENRSMLGGLTHIARNVGNAPSDMGAALSKTIGKDDLMLLPKASMPATHYVTQIFYDENTGWAMADIQILNENLMDDNSKQSIKRFKGLLRQGILPGTSSVVLAAWQSSGTGCDECKEIKQIKSLDITLNPSWHKAQIVEVVEDPEDFEEDREYSKKDYEFDGVKVKTFSSPSEVGISGVPKTTKIDGKFCIVKAKQFSCSGVVIEIPDLVEERNYTVATVKERVKYATKFSPRMRLRRLFLDYKQAVKSYGGRLDEPTTKALKSLFIIDVLEILKTVSPEIRDGKMITSVLGVASLGGPNLRKAAQKLQLPYRMALQESGKKGYLSQNRYKKLQAAYQEFAQAMVDEVFSDTPLPEGLEAEVKEEERGIR